MNREVEIFYKNKVSNHPKASKVTILVAEDNPGHSKLLLRTLKKSGVVNKTIVFQNGAKLLSYLQSSNENSAIYLLLLDLVMPKIDGIKILEKIKKIPRYKTLPVIITTISEHARELMHCHHLGYDHYLIKPVHFDQFVHALIQSDFFLKVKESSGSVHYVITNGTPEYINKDRELIK